MIVTLRKAGILTVIILAASGGFWLYIQQGQQEEGLLLLVSGTVEATEAQLGFETPGRIEEIRVHEGDRVKAGMEVASLDRVEMQARRKQALAQAAAMSAVLRELEHGFRAEEISQGRSALASAEERLNDARRDLERTRKLIESGAVSQESSDKATVAFDIAKSQYEQAFEQLRILESGPRTEKVEAQRAQLAQAEAAVSVIDATLANMVIRSPFDGLVTVRHREPREIVPAGAAVLTIMNPDDRWVRIYIPENRIGAVRMGHPAMITSDTYPDKGYNGQVIFISSEAEFTPKSVQTTEERVKLVYAAKVRITGDPGYELKPGMPADVRLVNGTP